MKIYPLDWDTGLTYCGSIEIDIRKVSHIRRQDDHSLYVSCRDGSAYYTMIMSVKEDNADDVYLKYTRDGSNEICYTPISEINDIITDYSKFYIILKDGANTSIENGFEISDDALIFFLKHELKEQN